MYSKEFFETASSYHWIIVILTTIAGLVMYVGGIIGSVTNMAFYNGIWMLSMGLWLENHLGRMEELEEETNKEMIDNEEENHQKNSNDEYKQ